jgi:hypothetical protein
MNKSFTQSDIPEYIDQIGRRKNYISLSLNQVANSFPILKDNY